MNGGMTVDSSDVVEFSYETNYRYHPALIPFKELFFVDQVSTSAAILSASTNDSQTCCGQTVKSYFQDPVHIENYLLDRIEEIININKFSHTPSAFTCILSFLDFLAQGAKNSTNNEGDNVKSYCKEYLKILRCKRDTTAEQNLKTMKGDKSWGEVLYKLLRCGLVHAMSSQGNRDPDQNQVKIILTHSPIDDGKEEDLSTDAVSGNSAVTITINAFDLCGAIKDSILRLFQDTTAKDNIQKYFNRYPPLLPINTQNPVSGKDKEE